jgi:glutamine amidotransferase-like uncharacterized protein
VTRSIHAMYLITHLKKYLLLTLSVFLTISVQAEPNADSTNYGHNRYTESISGNAPILILVPDGGTIVPSADANSTPAKSPDRSVKLFARKLIDEINCLTGHSPHAVFNHLHPSYLDVKSPLKKPDDKLRSNALREYREAKSAAAKKVLSAKGIVVDVCELDNRHGRIAALLKEARDAKGSARNFAISTLARGIIDEVNRQASINLYGRVKGKINVGIFRVKKSMSNSAIYAMRIDPNIRSIGIVTSQVAEGILDELDVIVLPGGGGSAQVRDLGKEGSKKVESFVERGGGYVGFCAGAYTGAERTAGKSSSTLNLLAGVHPNHGGEGWARGAAMTQFENTKALTDLLPEYNDADSVFYAYNQGPLLDMKDVPAVEDYVVLQRFASDVHHKIPDAKGIMPGRIALMLGDRKAGKVVLCSAHPEATPGMRWMAPRMVYWSLGRQGVSYAPQYVRPRQYQDEAMYDRAWNRATDTGLKLAMDPAKPTAQRLAALKKVVANNPRRFKSRADLEALLNDREKRIRAAAADAAIELDFFEATVILKDAYVNEQDDGVRKRIGEAIEVLDVL